MNPSTQAARVLVQALAAAGVRRVVLAPGSRSGPLAHALAHTTLPEHERAATAPELELHVRIDERAAGFLAVGLARAAALRGERAPVAVVTTSGTAVANLHPAVLEAHHAGLPLVLLTADRPHELRGTGANQTTEQKGIFAGAVRLMLDLSAPTGAARETEHLRRVAAEAVAVALGTATGDPGPVHVNLAYREPLHPDDDVWPLRPLPTRVARGAAATSAATRAATSADARAVPASTPPLPRGWTADEHTVVVAGDGAGPVARDIAEANGWPLLAEPSSGARGGPNAVPAYRLVLGMPLGDQVRRAVVLGRPTLSRAVLGLLSRKGVRTLGIVDRGSATPDAGRGYTHVYDDVPRWLLEPPGRTGEAWLGRWLATGRAARDGVQAVLDAATETAPVPNGPGVAAVLSEALGPEDVLVVGASNPVRDLDLVADWADPPTVVANRGLSGIDGTISTAAGVALGLGWPVTAYLGDLTFLHDVGGLLVGPLERVPDLRVVVANDDGGSVFAGLEHGAPEHAAAFERVFGTPQGAHLGALCAGFDVRHQRVADLASLREVLAEPVVGMSVVEVTVERRGRRDLAALLAGSAADAVAQADAAAQVTAAAARAVEAALVGDESE